MDVCLWEVANSRQVRGEERNARGNCEQLDAGNSI